MINKRDISDYYDNDVPAYASYDNIRKCASYCDGLKASQRKLVWASFKRCANEFIKTDTMCAQTQIDTAYIHGAANLEGVIDGMAANYVTSNNYSLFTGNSGGFGCRISPRPSAGRYTRVKMSPITKKLFLETDNEILEKQYFEGQWIEPRYLLPVFPVLFLNGSEGLSTGFSQKIYSRNPEEIILYIKKKLAGTEKPRMDLLPWFKGFLGKVEYNKEIDSNEIFGVVTKNNMTSYTVTEIPYGVEYQKYVETLDKLEENGTIVDYEDKCDPKTDKILFEIKTTRDFTRDHATDRSVLEAFRLIKTLPETYNCIDENNRIREFKSVQEILDAFIEIRLKCYDARKKHILETLKEKLTVLASKYYFIKGIVDGEIAVNKKKKDEIVAQLEKIEKIKKVDGSYNYLLAMPIHSLTKEKMEELKKQIEDGKEEYKKTKETSINDMWLDDLGELKRAIA